MFHSIFSLYLQYNAIYLCLKRYWDFDKGQNREGSSLPIPVHIPPLVIATKIMLGKEREQHK
jgi:hypothetical protein